MSLNLNIGSDRFRRVGVVLVLLSLALVFVQEINAQPGDRRTPQEKRKDLEKKIAEVEEEIANSPDHHYLYVLRGRAFTDLFRNTRDRSEQDSFAETAFADFATYEALTKQAPIEYRTELHQTIWHTQVPAPQNSESTSSLIDSFRNSSHFEAAVSGYLEMISGREEARGFERNDRRKCELYAMVANLYLFRAQVIAKIPVAMGTMYGASLVWEDFDKAIELKKKSIEEAYGISFVRDFYVLKAEAAFASGDYDRALDTYQAGDDYMAENWKWYCENRDAADCESAKKDHLDRFGMLRARVYLENGDYESAILNLDHYILKGPSYAATCARYYRMRAQAYRKLGKIKLAWAEEKKARELSDQYGCN